MLLIYLCILTQYVDSKDDILFKIDINIYYLLSFYFQTLWLNDYEPVIKEKT